MVLTRAPRPALQPFVDTLWAIEPSGVHAGAPPREHVLPTGQMHLAIRLSGGPLRLFDRAADAAGRVVGHAVVGGARAGFYVRDTSQPGCSVGAQLRPGAAEALFGVPADELAGRHTPLEDLWGRDVDWIREQLAEPAMLHQRIDRLESIIAARLSTRRVMHPAVPYALERLRADSRIASVLAATGCSHRTLISLFRRSVGLAPKEYCRVLRFRRVLRALSTPGARPLADVAIEAGFSDQAHFSREFRIFAGVTPTEYRRASPDLPYHLGLAGRR